MRGGLRRLEFPAWYDEPSSASVDVAGAAARLAPTSYSGCRPECRGTREFRQRFGGPRGAAKRGMPAQPRGGGMSSQRPVDPPAVRIEVENEWAWCGTRRLELTPRMFALLRHLVERPHRLITKDDLLAAVWRDTIVSDAALTSCIRDLREALGDSSDAPRYIQ